jgi:hypothetical protein
MTSLPRFLRSSARPVSWREELIESIHHHQSSRRRFLGRALAALGACSLAGGVASLDAYAQQVAEDNKSRAVIGPREPLKITKLETFFH